MLRSFAGETIWRAVVGQPFSIECGLINRAPPGFTNNSNGLCNVPSDASGSILVVFQPRNRKARVDNRHENRSSSVHYMRRTSNTTMDQHGSPGGNRHDTDAAGWWLTSKPSGDARVA